MYNSINNIIISSTIANIAFQICLIFGLSFFERPILDHDAKAHNFEIRRISWNLADFVKSGRYHVDFMWTGKFHMKNLINQMFQQKLFSLGVVQGRGYDLGFHEILGHSPHPAFIKLRSFCWNTCFYKVLGGFHVKSKDHLQGIVTLCFMRFCFQKKTISTIAKWPMHGIATLHPYDPKFLVSTLLRSHYLEMLFIAFEQTLHV